MALSDAGKIAENLADLAMRRAPRWGRTWESEVDFSVPQPVPASPNKRAGANGCEGLWAWDHDNDAAVDAACRWGGWMGDQPFMQNESMTPEDTYRVLHSYPFLVLNGLARRGGAPLAHVWGSEKLARSHFFWLLLGRSPHPARKVRNHHHGDADGCILVGDGEAAGWGRFVACAGMRAWVRAAKHLDSDFQFTMHDACGTIVAQGLGESYPKERQWVQRDILLGVLDRFGGALWCMDEDDRHLAADFAEHPTAAPLAAEIVSRLMPCQMPYWIDRYEDGSVFAVLLDNNNSSTDPKMLSAGLADGRTLAASCSDGIRSSSEPQHVTETETHYVIRMDAGSREVQVPKPAGVRRAWRVEAKDGRVFCHESGGQPGPQPPAGGEILYLGTHPDYPKSQIVGAREATTGARMFEIHGDPASGIARRWIVEPE